MRVDRYNPPPKGKIKTRVLYELYVDNRCLISFSPTSIKGNVPGIIEALINQCGLDISSLPTNPNTYDDHFTNGLGGKLKDFAYPNDHYFLSHKNCNGDFQPVARTTLYVQTILYYLPDLFYKLLSNSNLNTSTSDIWLYVDDQLMGTMIPHFSSNVPARLNGYNDEPYYSNIYYDERVPQVEIIDGLIGFLMEERKKIYNSNTLIDIEHSLNSIINTEHIKPRRDFFFDIQVILSPDTPFSFVTISDIEPEDDKEEDEESRRIKNKLRDGRRHGDQTNDNNYGNGGFGPQRVGANTYIQRPLAKYDIARRVIIIYYKNINCPDEESYKAIMANCLAHELFHAIHHMYIKNKFKYSNNDCKFVLEAVADSFSIQYLEESKRSTGSVNYESACDWVIEERIRSWFDYIETTWPYAYALYLYDLRRAMRYGWGLRVAPLGLLTLWDVNKFGEVLFASKTNMKNACKRLMRL